MAKLLTTLLFTISIAASLARAGSYYVPYLEVLPEAASIVEIDPLVSADGEFHGYVVCDTARQVVSIVRWNEPAVDIDHEYIPLSSVNRYSRDGDSLYLYTVEREPTGTNQHLNRYVVVDNEVELTATRSLRILSLAEADICRSEVSLVFDDSAVTGVLFQTVIREEIDESIGWSE
ncbi:hypothetical protein GF420_07000, partial [candidate division GN15 bacterium]|nr:hypothetical protein [candidate division GN15 bacterium]